MISCERGVMKLGLFAVLLLALNILDIRFVFVSKAAYTTVKQNPAPNLQQIEFALVLKIQQNFISSKPVNNTQFSTNFLPFRGPPAILF